MNQAGWEKVLAFLLEFCVLWMVRLGLPCPGWVPKTLILFLSSGFSECCGQSCALCQGHSCRGKVWQINSLGRIGAQFQIIWMMNMAPWAKKKKKRSRISRIFGLISRTLGRYSNDFYITETPCRVRVCIPAALLLLQNLLPLHGGRWELTFSKAARRVQWIRASDSWPAQSLSV